ARQNTDQLADLLRTDPDEQPDGWPLRGEILAHVDRLRTELQPSHTGHRGATGPMRMMRMRKTLTRPRARVKHGGGTCWPSSCWQPASGSWTCSPSWAPGCGCWPAAT